MPAWRRSTTNSPKHSTHRYRYGCRRAGATTIRPAGINAHADAIWAEFISRRGSDNQRNILWWDWEEFNSSTRSSINVPSSVGYLASRDTFHAAFYEVSIFPGFRTFQVMQAHADELRAEAVRYSAGVAKRLCDRADAARITGYEQLSYAHPGVPGEGASWASQAAQIIQNWFCPYMLGGGP
jgi:hypothetical protein